MDGITNEGFVAGMSVLAAAIAMLPAALTGFAQATAVGRASEAIGKQPEAKSQVQGTMIVGLALAETSGIYGLLVAIMILIMNPFNISF